MAGLQFCNSTTAIRVFSKISASTNLSELQNCRPGTIANRFFIDAGDDPIHMALHQEAMFIDAASRVKTRS